VNADASSALATRAAQAASSAPQDPLEANKHSQRLLFCAL